MGNNQLLCYKLCFCLGMETETLMERYSNVHALIQRDGYLKNVSEDVRLYRCIMRLYFLLIRHYNLYRRVKSIFDVSGDRLAPYLLGLDFKPDDIFKASGSVCDCLNILAKLANDQLPQVYTELEIGLPFSDFSTLVELPQLKEQDILQVQFMLKRVSPHYNFYFFASPVFNVSVPDMLKSDMTLIKRMELVTGRHVARTKDKSALAVAMQQEDDRAFLCLEDIPKFDYVFMDNAAVSVEIKNILPSLFTANPESYIWCKNRLQCFNSLTEKNTPQNSLLITHCYDTTLDRMVEQMERVSFLLTMPLPHTTYYRALRHSWPNTYLLSIKNSKIIDGAKLV